MPKCHLHQPVMGYLLSAKTESYAADMHLLQLVAAEAHQGLGKRTKTLPPWLFYDDVGSHLFDQITNLPEYYVTRTERDILLDNAIDMLQAARVGRDLEIIELGAGTGKKSIILLAALSQLQDKVVYRPVDVSEGALQSTKSNIRTKLPHVRIVPQIANYTTDDLNLESQIGVGRLVVYLGSSIGNFSPAVAQDIMSRLRAQLHEDDSVLLGVDLVKQREMLISAYDDNAGTTAAFNLNILRRLNRDLGANFNLADFRHKVLWNEDECCIEMHLESTVDQRVFIPPIAGQPALSVEMRAGETIHTECSYKFSYASLDSLLRWSGFAPERIWHDRDRKFAMALARAS